MKNANMKNIIIERTEKSIMFKDKTKIQPIDCILAPLMFGMSIFANAYAIKNFDSYKYHLIFFVPMLVFFSVLLVLQIKVFFNKSIPYLNIDENGISIATGVFLKILKWEEFKEMKIISNVAEAGGGWPRSYVCFSPEVIDEKQFRKNIYKISARIVKRNKVFPDNLIYLALVRERLKYFTICVKNILTCI